MRQNKVDASKGGRAICMPLFIYLEGVWAEEVWWDSSLFFFPPSLPLFTGPAREDRRQRGVTPNNVQGRICTQDMAGKWRAL